jgi:predicted RNase H-related nuclease YkuK (DUF458 family)
MVRKPIDIEEVKTFINSQTPATKIYIGGDSERLILNGVWYADYTNVVVVHMNGNRGCRVFGEVVRERDYDQRKNRPSMRLMNEVIKTANLYLSLADALEDREVEIHLDINPDIKHGSSCVINEAVGYIRGTCNIVPLVKPNAWAASYCADRLKDIMAHKPVQAA